MSGPKYTALTYFEMALKSCLFKSYTKHLTFTVLGFRQTLGVLRSSGQRRLLARQMASRGRMRGPPCAGDLSSTRGSCWPARSCSLWAVIRRSPPGPWVLCANSSKGSCPEELSTSTGTSWKPLETRVRAARDSRLQLAQLRAPSHVTENPQVLPK